MTRSRTLVCALGAALFLGAHVGAAGALARLIPPVDAAVTRPFEPPTSPYGPGHRGLDYGAATGVRVRAAGAGRVRFAGNVAGVLAVTIDHGDGLETTYSSLSEIDVAQGQTVAQGAFIGRVGVAHAGESSGLHFGVKLDGDYVDPELYLGSVDLAAAVHLAPVVWQPPDFMPDAFKKPFEDAGGYRAACGTVAPLTRVPPPPNDNVAVAIAGIGSRTKGSVSATMYEHGPSFLGYAGDHIYYFSYKGSDGPARHEPYERKYSYEGLRAAARQLASLMRGIALDHPGTDVDLIAHSQGGIVARTYLEEMAKSENVHLPRVAHFITFSSPHTGAPLASNVASLQRTSAGRWVVARASDAARSGMPIPDPLSPAVAELAPGSGLMRSLARQDIEFGTRALALSTPDDPIVPADHARYPGHENRVVPPVVAWDPHDGIVSSPVAEGLTYDFLRDSPSSCLTGWDRWGPMVGAVVSGIEGRLGSAFNLGVGAARWVGAHALVP